MIINGIDFGPIAPVRLTVRPSQAVAQAACSKGFNEVIDKCCPEAKGQGVDQKGRYILTSDPEIALADMLKHEVSWENITWAFRILEGPEAERTLRLFAAACAAETLTFFESKHPGDSRPRVAVEASVGFVHGTVTQEQLAASWAATCAAASVAAEAARAATCAASWAAAEAATCAAAWAAAESAAWTAAEAASWVAADATSWVAAGDIGKAVARKRQRQILATFLK